MDSQDMYSKDKLFQRQTFPFGNESQNFLKRDSFYYLILKKKQNLSLFEKNFQKRDRFCYPCQKRQILQGGGDP